MRMTVVLLRYKNLLRRRYVHVKEARVSERDKYERDMMLEIFIVEVPGNLCIVVKLWTA